MIGEIISSIRRGITTFTCTCDKPKVRIYQVIEGEDKEVLVGKVCLSCSATTMDEWRSVRSLEDIRLIGGAEEYYKLNN